MELEKCLTQIARFILEQCRHIESIPSTEFDCYDAWILALERYLDSISLKLVLAEQRQLTRMKLQLCEFVRGKLLSQKEKNSREGWHQLSERSQAVIIHDLTKFADLTEPFTLDNSLIHLYWVLPRVFCRWSRLEFQHEVKVFQELLREFNESCSFMQSQSYPQFLTQMDSFCARNRCKVALYAYCCLVTCA